MTFDKQAYMREYMKKWYSKNRDEWNEWRNAYMQKYRRKHPNYERDKSRKYRKLAKVKMAKPE